MAKKEVSRIIDPKEEKLKLILAQNVGGKTLDLLKAVLFGGESFAAGDVGYAWKGKRMTIRIALQHEPAEVMEYLDKYGAMPPKCGKCGALELGKWPEGAFYPIRDTVVCPDCFNKFKIVDDTQPTGKIPGDTPTPEQQSELNDMPEKKIREGGSCFGQGEDVDPEPDPSES